MRPRFVFPLLAAALAAGLAGARLGPFAEAQIINIIDLPDEEIGSLVPNTDLRSRSLVVTQYGTVAVQSGNVAKHFHADANEVQLILSGSGSF
jgi:hypothetical protein